MALIVKKVTKSFDKVSGPVLSDVSFKIEAGEIVAVIGPNGSGKSTLLSIIAGLLSPDTGEVRLDKEKLEGPEKNLVPGHEEIKLVFQDYGLKPSMTVRENIRYQLLDFKESYQQERINEVLELCELKGLEKRKPGELSGGQQQRVSLANAMATDPQVLLMDEPFSNLDPFTKEEMISEVKRIAKETNTTIVIVTHDGIDALSLADRVAFLDEGTIQQFGTPGQLYYQPENQKIGHFLGYLSLLSDQTKKRLGVDSGKKIAIRAEHLHLDPDGYEYKVLDIDWKGFYQLGFLDQGDRPHPLILLLPPGHQLNATVRISFETNRFIYF